MVVLEKVMSVIKVIEIMAESSVSWEDAARQAVAKVTKTIYRVKSLYVENHSVKIENGVITAYRISAKVSFELD